MVRRTAAAAAVYALIGCAFTWPLVLHLGSLFGAEDPGGDPSLYLWTLGWDFHTISTHPLWLLTGRVFDANIFVPAARTLAYSDHLLLQALVLWPVYAATHNLVFCYNVLLSPRSSPRPWRCTCWRAKWPAASGRRMWPG